jgi:AraC-like DNA-binding protein
MRDMILLTNTVLENNSLENEELLQLNRIINRNDLAVKQEQTRQLLAEEEENDDSAFRHSYHDEQLLMQAIREGRTEDALRLTENMDKDSGRLAGAELPLWRNLAIIGISLCTRAAIEGGLSPEEGYRLSGYYIQKCDLSHDPAHLLHHRNRAIEELTVRVRSAAEKPRGSGHVERCKDYVRKHYREKIYLEDVAEALGISPTYLSKLFKKETGQCLQDYINEERIFRAANLLIYSRLSLPEIAEYVHFPNQSYFGKIFRQFRHMTPREYRDRYTPSEATE